MKRSVTAGLTALLLIGAAAPALAAPEPRDVAQKSKGLGVCVSQVAVQPGLIGVERLGQAARELAQDKMIQEEQAGLRNACGGPPGPGHLR